MESRFEILGLTPTLSVSGDTLRAAFREAGKSAHPDAGGADAEFAGLREAFETLSSPSRRLRHWLELRGVPVETRGTVDSRLMDLFGKVGAVSQQAEAVIRKRGDARSALGLALLEAETHAARDAVEQAIRRIDEAIEIACGAFPAIEAGDCVDPDEFAMLVRNLAFLEKWRAGLRACFSRLI